MAHGTHDFEDDPRNAGILVWVNGELVPRERAVVSVFAPRATGADLIPREPDRLGGR